MSGEESKPGQNLQRLREAAEAQLTQDADSLTNDKLLHELQVHQIELEMQNEELRRAHLALEASRSHYVELYDFAPVGYLTLTAEGTIAEINLFGVKLLGLDRRSLINRRFAQFIADEDKDRWYRFCFLTMRSGGRHSCELRLRHNNGTFFYTQLDCLSEENGQVPQMLRIAFNDISERKKAEEEQRVAAAAFETQEGIVVSDASMSILRVNHAFGRITGYDTEEVVGLKTDILRSKRHDENFYKTVWMTIVADGYWQGEVWVKRKSGQEFPIWLTLTAVSSEDGNISHYVASLIDISLQKKAEKMLLDSRRNLVNEVVSTKEELEKIKEESLEVNAAFNVMTKLHEAEKNETQIQLSREMEETVLPFVEKMKKTCIGQAQSLRLIEIVEANLRHLMKSYGRSADLAAAYQKLTPVERQVASMIRQGLSTKTIAAALNISQGTVGSHRKHIRKKLSLDGKSTNLSSYLASLAE